MNRKTIDRLRAAVATIASCAIIGLGFIPAAQAGVVSTGQSIALAEKQQQIDTIRGFLSRQDVSEQLVLFGVAPEAVSARLDGLTPAELAELHDAIEQGVAGGDALALIGAVFLVLLILELLGVTNVFSSF